MRKVRFSGVRRVGTLRPRRMWSPGEVLEVKDDVAEELKDLPGFTVLGRSTRRPRTGKTPEDPEAEE